MSKNLTVFYDAEDINDNLDKAIEETMKAFDYHRWASGYDLTKKQRNLAFDKLPCGNCGSKEHVANECPANAC